MREHHVIPVDDEHVPLGVHALFSVVVGDGGIETFRFVPIDSVSYQEPGVVGGRRPGRCGRRGQTGVGLPLYLSNERRSGRLIHLSRRAGGAPGPGRPLFPGGPDITPT